MEKLEQEHKCCEISWGGGRNKSSKSREGFILSLSDARMAQRLIMELVEDGLVVPKENLYPLTLEISTGARY